MNDPFLLRFTGRARRYSHEVDTSGSRSSPRVVSDVSKLHYECRIAVMWLREGFLSGVVEAVPPSTIGFKQFPTVIQRC